VSPRAARRLRQAKNAIAHVKNVIIFAGNQSEGLEFSAYNSLMRRLVQRFDAFWDSPGSATARDLIDFGISLGPNQVTAADVYDGLQRFAATDTGRIASWSDKKLDLWCASQVDPAVLRSVITHDSSEANVIGAGIRDAKAEGRLDWVWDHPDTAEEGRKYHYSEY
jgi:hypothetical protein